MEKTLYVAFHGEGPTDERLFINLSERLIKSYLLKNDLTAKISWLVLRDKGSSSSQTLISTAISAKDQDILIFHRDADDLNWAVCYNNHFEDGISTLNALQEDTVCKRIIAAIPVKETEAWILIDKELLRDIIESDLTIAELGLNYLIKNIERIGDPKHTIENAIRINKQNLPAKRRKFAISRSEIYEKFSQEVNIQSLERLSSFKQFKTNVISALNAIFKAQS